MRVRYRILLGWKNCKKHLAERNCHPEMRVSCRSQSGASKRQQRAYAIGSSQTRLRDDDERGSSGSGNIEYDWRKWDDRARDVPENDAWLGSQSRYYLLVIFQGATMVIFSLVSTENNSSQFGFKNSSSFSNDATRSSSVLSSIWSCRISRLN